MISTLNTQGQTLLEFIVSIVLVALPIGAASLLLLEHWNQTQCVYTVFEKTHSKRISRRPPFYVRHNIPVRMIDDEKSITGQAECPFGTERVTLPKLEAAQW